ncbi:outer membrane protein assembly factor BamE [Enterovirga sp.]|jgi:outer membrane protein assembly factor BamE (lipoprotein component of BamABCDE complex)|uniref:outer membrane protein assembly factor BamE n=1 Tax=Enterovirga sp. TaxID=2026350 RepID=UPI0026258020|nr:outer membrane protein assembly factor BamE [Enterovirga sp.]MDB5592407.1 SmpA/OmlA domain protein [Enterovirga sp.]
MSRPGYKPFARLAGAVLLGSLLTGCMIGEDLHRGYVVDERAVAQVKPGLGPEQVLQILGTPSTVSTVGNKSWYYISQTSSRTLQFMGERVTDQRVTAVYFTPGFKVQRVALYGMQDGRVFDFISRKTEAGGQEANFVAQLFRGLGTFIPN